MAPGVTTQTLHCPRGICMPILGSSDLSPIGSFTKISKGNQLNMWDYGVEFDGQSAGILSNTNCQFDQLTDIEGGFTHEKIMNLLNPCLQHLYRYYGNPDTSGRNPETIADGVGQDVATRSEQGILQNVYESMLKACWGRN